MKFLPFRRANKTPKRIAKDLIRGERHPFRNLTVPQYLQDGQIVSSREHEVTREDPLLQRVRRLESALQLIAAQTDDHNIHRVIQETLK